MFVKKIDTNPEGTDASDLQSGGGTAGACGRWVVLALTGGKYTT